MASRAIKQCNNGVGGYIVSFLVDATVDMDTLQTNVAIGSKAFCIENQTNYILSIDKEWKEV